MAGSLLLWLGTGIDMALIPKASSLVSRKLQLAMHWKLSKLFSEFETERHTLVSDVEAYSNTLICFLLVSRLDKTPLESMDNLSLVEKGKG